jgi:hypothetical protein
LELRYGDLLQELLRLVFPDILRIGLSDSGILRWGALRLRSGRLATCGGCLGERWNRKHQGGKKQNQYQSFFHLHVSYLLACCCQIWFT